MSITTCDAGRGPSQAELAMLLRAAARCASPTEQGRAQARKVTSSLLTGLTLVAGTIASYDVALLAASW